LTSPMTAALGATKTVSSITGDLSNSFIIVWCLDTARERERENKNSWDSINISNLVSNFSEGLQNLYFTTL
jgi:hypothetical protein